MEQSFWKTRWDEGQIGFHEQGGNAMLREHWPTLVARQAAPRTDAAARVLVPLCGKTVDLTWLAQSGHVVVGVEFVERAAVDYFAELGVTPTRTERGGAVCYAHGAVSIWVADFFAISSELVGSFDFVYDRGALVAVTPEQRERYIPHLAQLCKPGAGLFLISFEHDMGSGPPFSVDHVADRMLPYFDVERHAAQDVLDAEPRFKERGASYMIEVVWLGTRRP
jgi:thiopurine S-methyltransferase